MKHEFSGCSQMADGTFRAPAFVGDTFSIRLAEPGDAISDVTNSSKPAAGSEVTFTTAALGSETSELDAPGVYTFAVTFASGIVATLNVIVFPVAALSHAPIKYLSHGVERGIDDRKRIFRSLVRDVNLTTAPTVLAGAQWWLATLLVGGKTGDCIRLSDYGATHGVTALSA